MVVREELISSREGEREIKISSHREAVNFCDLNEELLEEKHVCVREELISSKDKGEIQIERSSHRDS